MKNQIHSARLGLLLLVTIPMQAKYKVIYKLRPAPNRSESPKHPNPNAIETITTDPDRIIQCIEKYLSNTPVIVEASAYNGTITKRLALLWPLGTIYAFEPMPENFAKLERLSLPNIKNVRLALSDQTGSTDFFSSAHITKPSDDNPTVVFNQTITVPTVTLDDWARQNNVKSIDLLWLDLQGYELNILKASPDMLKTVKVICTEVELVEAYEGQYLYKDVKNFLESQGFKLIARDFEESSQNWFGNAVFVKISLP